jgi:hypothetical protein
MNNKRKMKKKLESFNKLYFSFLLRGMITSSLTMGLYGVQFKGDKLCCLREKKNGGVEFNDVLTNLLPAGLSISDWY